MIPTIYFDTGILVKLFVRESNSELAVQLINEAGLPLSLSHFHDMEVPNAIRLKRCRGRNLANLGGFGDKIVPV